MLKLLARWLSGPLEGAPWMHAVARMVCLSTAFTACTSDSLLESRPRVVTVGDYVTGDAARGLDPSGHFVLATSSGGALAELALAQAEAYAQAWATELGPELSTFLEQGHGGPINYDRLQVCRQSVYAASSFEPVPPSAPAFVQGQFGGWWLIALCEGRAVEISLAVQAIGTGLTLTNGHIGFLPDGNGGHFFAIGVPSWWDGPVPISAEHAVVDVGLGTGRQIDAIPILIAPSNLRGPPQVAVWQIHLDSTVFVRGTGTERGGYTRQLYEGLLGWNSSQTTLPTMATPLPAQPTVQVLDGTFGQIALAVKSTSPIFFEAAIPTRAPR